MLIIQRGLGGDLTPRLLCCVCGKPLTQHNGWLAFTAVTALRPARETKWLHRACMDGQARALFGSRQVTLWRGRDVLERLLRMTEGEG